VLEVNSTVMLDTVVNDAVAAFPNLIDRSILAFECADVVVLTIPSHLFPSTE
jgi:hypothetical protein